MIKSLLLGIFMIFSTPFINGDDINNESESTYIVDSDPNIVTWVLIDMNIQMVL